MDDINSDRLQYSQDAINTTIDIMSNVAIKMEGQTPMSNTTTKRRKLNAWNVFTKRKSLVRVLRHRLKVIVIMILLHTFVITMNSDTTVKEIVVEREIE